MGRRPDDVALEALSAAAAGLQLRFPLDEEPSSLSTISVEVNGQGVAQDLYDGWTYEVEPKYCFEIRILLRNIA